MSSYVTGSDYNASTGFFEITTTDATGATSTQSVSFTTLCMIFSLTSLQSQDEVFNTQFEDASNQITSLTQINDCMQMFNKYSAQVQNADDGSVIELDGYVAISHDGGAVDADVSGCKSITYVSEQGNTDTMYYTPGSDADMWINTYRPALVESGLVQDGTGTNNVGVGTDCLFYPDEFNALMENLQTAQTTLSSQNEQQMLVTNDAASKRSTILQMAQSLLKQATDARESAAQT